MAPRILTAAELAPIVKAVGSVARVASRPVLAGSQGLRAPPPQGASSTLRGHALGRVALGPTETLRGTDLDEDGVVQYALPAVSTLATARARPYERNGNYVAVGVDGAKPFPFCVEQAETAGVTVCGHASTAGKRGVS